VGYGRLTLADKNELIFGRAAGNKARQPASAHIQEYGFDAVDFEAVRAVADDGYRRDRCRDLAPERQETPDGPLPRREVLVHKSSLLIFSRQEYLKSSYNCVVQ
jgi:hypothetical protein